MENLMIDSDVLINWLMQEREKNTNRELWIAPSTILELGEARQLFNHISLLSVFEIRFVLRRKKGKNLKEIEQDLNALQKILQIEVPTGIVLQQADQLQSEWPLDPFDSILLSQAITLKTILVTRDSRFMEIAKHYITAFLPEEYINTVS